MCFHMVVCIWLVDHYKFLTAIQRDPLGKGFLCISKPHSALQKSTAESPPPVPDF